MIIKSEAILRKLFFVSWIIYFISYIGRLNYAASMIEIGKDRGYTTSQLGAIITAFFISYGVGQLISGLLGDILSPSKLIITGLVASSICNGLVVVTKDWASFIMIWGINGLSVSLIWPPMMKLFTRYMPKEYLKKSCFHIQTSVALGTCCTYVLCSILIAKWEWTWAFRIASLVLIMAACLGYRVFKDVEAYAIRYGTHETPSIESIKKAVRKPFEIKILIYSRFIGILIIVLIMGFLKDGIMTWIPQYLSDTFHTNQYFAIFLSAILPLMNLGGIYLGKWVYYKNKEDDLMTTGMLYSVSVVSLLGLILCNDYSVYLSIFFFSVVTGCMLGINTVIGNVVPTYFEKYGKSCTIAGIINSVTYIGSALCGYGLGMIVEGYGWYIVSSVLLGLGSLAILICIMSLSRWNRFKRECLD